MFCIRFYLICQEWTPKLSLTPSIPNNIAIATRLCLLMKLLGILSWAYAQSEGLFGGKAHTLINPWNAAARLSPEVHQFTLSLQSRRDLIWP